MTIASLIRLSRRVRRALTVLGLAATLAAPAVVSAQAPATRGQMLTRADIESAAQSAQGAGRAMEAAALRSRLVEGDFGVGDRVVLTMRVDSVVHDTLVVREGPMLRIPALVDVPLRGVLRSELEARVRQELARVVRAPDAEVHGLVRVAVLGEVTRPGYYYVTADMLVSDAIMVAGGPTALAQPERSVVRRAGATLLAQESVRDAIQRGATLDALGLRAGDEIVVGKKKDRMGGLQVTAMVVGLLGSVVTAATLLSR